MRVFNPFSVTYKKSTLKACYRRNELEKCRCYDERIRLVEHGSFTPLTFTVGGGIGPAASIFYKMLASILSGAQLDEMFALFLFTSVFYSVPQRG